MKKLFIFMLLLCLSTSHTIVHGEMMAKVSLEEETITAVAIDVPVRTPMSTCDHVYRIPPNANIIAQGWYAVNDLYHEYRKFYIASCIKEGCVADGEICVAEQVEKHDWKYTGIHYHNKGLSTHAYVHVCLVCGTVMNYDFPCGGTGNGDCPLYTFPMVSNPKQ